MQVTLCDPYLSALEAFAKTRYTNRRYLYLYLGCVDSRVELGWVDSAKVAIIIFNDFTSYTLCFKKLHPFYFSNNFVDPGPISIIFGNYTPEENCNKTCIVFPTTSIFAPLLYLVTQATNLTVIHSDKHQNQMVKSGKSQDADKTFKNKSRQSEQVHKVSTSVSFHTFTQISNF